MDVEEGDIRVDDTGKATSPLDSTTAKRRAIIDRGKRQEPPPLKAWRITTET